MNWSRIRFGTLLAGLVLFLVDVATALIARQVFASPDAGVLSYLQMVAYTQLVPDLVIGFLVCWLYALARPRLGPGPRTALVMGSIAFALAFHQLINPMVWIQSARQAAIGSAINWVKFVAAAYLAGWVYIEKAPD